MKEIIGTDIKTINIKVPLSIMFERFGNCVADVKLFGSNGTFRFAYRGFISIEGDVLWKDDKEFVASIKDVNFYDLSGLDVFLSLISTATNKARLDMNVLYSDNLIYRVFVQDKVTRIEKINLLVSDYALSLVNDLPIKDEAISKFLYLVSQLQRNNLEVLIPYTNKREVIEKVNSCLLKKKKLAKEQSDLDRAITLYLRGQSGNWIDEIWMNKNE